MAKKNSSNTPWIVAGIGLAGMLGYFSHQNAQAAKLSLLQRLPIPTDVLTETILGKSAQQLAALGYYNGPYVPGEAAGMAAANAYVARNPLSPPRVTGESNTAYSARVITAIDASYRRMIGL